MINHKKRNKFQLIAVLVICLSLTISVACFLALHTNASASNYVLDDLYEGVDKDYVSQAFTNQDSEKTDYNNYYMISINDPSSLYTWTETGEPRFWKLDKPLSLKNSDDSEQLDVNFRFSFLPSEDSSTENNYLFIDCVDANDSSVHYKISCYCVLHDSSKARYNTDDAQESIKIYKKDIKYELSNIACINVWLKGSSNDPESLESSVNDYVSKVYPEGLEKNRTVQYCLDAEKQIDDYLAAIAVNDYYKTYLKKVDFKLEDLSFKNLSNAKDIIREDKNYLYYNFLCPDYLSKIDQFGTVAELSEYLSSNQAVYLEIAKVNLKNWFSSLSDLDKYNAFDQYSSSLAEIFNRIDACSTFDELFKIINDSKNDPYLQFLFYKATVNNDNNLTLGEERIMQAIQLYRTHGNMDYEDFDAIFDLDEYLKEAGDYDPRLKECWNNIFNKWLAMNKDENYVNIGNIPEGLENSNQLCIAVHGFGLNDDGSMKQEYIDRLDIAYATWQKYPNSYIAIMGGGTAKDAPDKTEADVGADYIISKGMPELQIIRENKSKNTIQNVEYLMDIFSRDSRYAQINQICICSSDYHIRRCASLWESKIEGARLLPEIYNKGVAKNMSVVSNISCKIKDIWSETINTQGLWIERLMFYPDFSGNIQSVVPSIINEMYTDTKPECFVGESYNPTVYVQFLRDNDNIEPIEAANDDNQDLFTFDQEVTKYCQVDCDTSKVGKTLCTITMPYNYPEYELHTLEFEVDVKAQPGPGPDPQPVEDVTVNGSTINTTAQTGDFGSQMVEILMLIVVMSFGLIWLNSKLKANR